MWVFFAAIHRVLISIILGSSKLELCTPPYPPRRFMSHFRAVFFLSQTNAAVNREINAMKSQIAQLTSMLRMSLDLQTDIQRSIKQEVAAAMNQNRTGKLVFLSNVWQYTLCTNRFFN